ncbi:hypothetical protein E2A64_10435 [Pseudohoeflea suaedae]|uniref:Uncharacterized protein n=1 Tax=Pseudohoeflea suaedae TaxID=877384 RepID=A0A4R5PJA8_9HYPH|nr:hypothetical protein [Pseudohoeflea suaedae]TDH35743.1 hypothetical protein E2A64_10435 [Pseudohoeflea suaedae]
MKPAIKHIEQWQPHPTPLTAANDNRKAPLIGITGKRNVGKSTAARMLNREWGFKVVHAFDGGKSAANQLFWYMTGDIDKANAMVYGDLKDKPCPELPGGVAPRYFLEKFGKFMGVDMGVEWTLGMEISRARRNDRGKPIVVESLVYESDWFKRAGGVVIRLERPYFYGPAGVESDSVQALVEADYTICAATVDEMLAKVRRAVLEICGA